MPNEVTSHSTGVSRRTEILAVGGGKGGSGKSFVAANLGVSLSRRGRAVIMVDTDLGGANLHTLLGLSLPVATLDDFINGRINSIEEVIVRTEVPNLGLVIGARDVLNAANAKVHQKLKIIRHIQNLKADYVIVDLGAGNSFNVLDFFLISDGGMLVITPEPTSVENAYRFIKSAFYRKVRRLTRHQDARRILETAMDQRSERKIRTPLDLVEAVEGIDEEMGRRLKGEMERFRPKLILNQVRTKGDMEVGFSMRSSCLRFFGIHLDYFGYVAYDNEVWESVQRRKPIVLERPYARASRCIAEITNRLIRQEQAASG
ncbi:MAG: P-loop NTPase [Deltaproteobacteria bacterium]|nr:P-loop NTPase [Deltaproteobacteria bacterium]